MSRESAPKPDAIAEAARQIAEAARARKCWPCGCLHNSITAIERAFPQSVPSPLAEAMEAARQGLEVVRYDCLGCEVCYPALAINALAEAGSVIGDGACPGEAPARREGWPPLAGDYRVLRYGTPVALCTLNNAALVKAVADQSPPGLSLVGTLCTENLGIERLITNVTANPHIRFLILCGPDSKQAVGHLPGQSLLALARQGLGTNGRINGAKGKRPILRNVASGMVEHFIKQVEVIDLVGCLELPRILLAISQCAAKDPGPVRPYEEAPRIVPIQGGVPGKTILDPAGYFVVYADSRHGQLVLEHYRKDGTLDALIEGRSAPELYFPAIERGLLTRLDHAAYLGKELARAEAALRSGDEYVQDAAPERPMIEEQPAPPCGCGDPCGSAVP